MALKRVSDTKDWELSNDDQDIRGWRVVGGAGDDLGTIDDLTIDTDAKLVDSITLKSGAEYPASEVEIGDGVVYIEDAKRGEGEAPAVRVYDDAKVRRREAG